MLITIPILILSYSCSESEYPMKIGDNYFFIYCPSWGYANITDSREVIIIKMEVVAWNYDSTFIIAKQKPFREIYDSILVVYPNIPSDKMDKLYHATEKYYYWIVDKREELDSELIFLRNGMPSRKYFGSVNGPYSYEKYWERRKEIGVPDTLKLLETDWRKKYCKLTRQYYWRKIKERGVVD